MTAVTLDHVAEAAGVSPSTVSRALSRPHAVNASTLERVLNAAKSLGYERSPRRDRSAETSWAIGISVPDIANPVVAPLIKWAQHEARRNDCTLVVWDFDESAEDEATVAGDVIEHVNAVILGSPRMSDDEVYEIAARVPTVTVNREVPDVAAVTFDDVGLAQAVEHLAALGHHRIHYLAGPAASYSNARRSATLSRACERHGIEFLSIGPSQPTYESGLRLADIVLSMGAGAVVAFNDLIALGLMSGLRARGVTIPSEVSVVGIDDIWLDDVAVPPLTTVRTPWRGAGTAAVRTLLDMRLATDGATAPMTTLPTELIVRASTSVAR